MKSYFRSQNLLLTLTALCLAVVSPAFSLESVENQLILKASPHQLESLVAEYGLAVLDSLEANGRNLYLVEGPFGTSATDLAALIGNDNRILGVGTVEVAAMRREEDATIVSPSDAYEDLHRTGTISAPCMNSYISEQLWSGYADQRLVNQIGLHQGHQITATLGCGGATVAIIDTGVDPQHPILQGALVPGYDFHLNSVGYASEWMNLDQSVAAIVEQSVAAIVEQSVAAIVEGDMEVLELNEMISPILDQSVAAIVESYDLPPSFGHGTMVAGLVRLVAPGAKIMPLKVFDGNGEAHLFNILRAIYYAVDNGADIINMSFSMAKLDHELLEAVRYARQNGVVVVAAAGNQAQQTHVYPAALAQALGVASVNFDDSLSAFSNHGSGMVSLAAPGAAVISTYPGGLYAAGWGTSFSTPLVAGAAAMVHRRPADRNNGSSAVNATENDILQGSQSLAPLNGLIGSGRLDVEGMLWSAGQ